MTANVINSENMNIINPFSRSIFIDHLKKNGLFTTDSAANHLIDRMVTSGSIKRIGRNQYMIGSDLNEYSFPYSEISQFPTNMCRSHDHSSTVMSGLFFKCSSQGMTSLESSAYG